MAADIMLNMLSNTLLNHTIQYVKQQKNKRKNKPPTFTMMLAVGIKRLFNGRDHGGAAKTAKDGTSGTLVRCDGLPNIVRRRRRNFWDGIRCQSGQS